MSNNKKSQDVAGSDDISGLFERFGAHADARRYQPFDHPDLPRRAEPVAGSAPPPLPDAPAAVMPLRKLRPVEASDPEPVAGTDTPLARLFQRLLQDGAEVRAAGPLRRLFPR